MRDGNFVKELVREFLFFGLMAGMLVALVFPFYWMVKTSLESGGHLFTYPPNMLPAELDTTGYARILTGTDIGLWLWNSFVVSAVSTLLALLSGVSGAYALSRFKYRAKKALAILILTTQMMPIIVLIIPIYVIFSDLNLSDSIMGLVLGNFSFSLPVVIWMMKSIFDSIAVEIEEAARVDGASWLGILRRITLPIARPGLVAVSIYTFIAGWDEFLLARTIVSSAHNWVGSIGLASFFGQYTTPWDQVLAAATIFTVPPVVLFLLVQKHFIAGLGAGAVKG